MLEHYAAMVPLSSANEVVAMTPVSALQPGGVAVAGRTVAFAQAVNNNVGEGTITVKQEASLLSASLVNVGVCANCGRGIADRFLLRVNERDYHEQCLACAVCSTPLSRTCYTRDCKFYCREDYERIYGVKCGRCQQKLDCNDLVMKVHTPRNGNNVVGGGVNGRSDGPIFHVECFVCCVCNEQLMRGAHFILRHGQPLCKREFQNDIYNMNSPQDDDLLDDSRPRDGRRGPKRPRTILTSVQRRQFKASFEVSPKPCRKVREALAKDTGLSVRVVQVWFQNQRAKMKKLQRKAKTETGTDKDIKEERNKPESPHSDHSHYMNALTMRDGESSNFPSSTQPLNPNNPYSPDDAYPGHSGESFCSSDISIDGTEAGFELVTENSEHGPDATTTTSSHHSHHSNQSMDLQSLSQGLHAVVHNPINKLFMMQTSYFSGADHP